MLPPYLAPWNELRSCVATASELLRDVLRLLKTMAHSRAAMAAEILFLRKQLAYYEEHQIRPRRLTDASRLSLLLWSRLFDWRKALKIEGRDLHSVASQGFQALLAVEVTGWPSTAA